MLSCSLTPRLSGFKEAMSVLRSLNCPIVEGRTYEVLKGDLQTAARKRHVNVRLSFFYSHCYADQANRLLRSMRNVHD